MDIIITIPRRNDFKAWLWECENAEKNDLDLNFHVANLPKEVNPGDRCFVVYRGVIKGYNVIKELKQKPGFICSTTGMEWPEGKYIIREGKFYPLKEHISMKGFQGWRYVSGDLAWTLHNAIGEDQSD